MKNVSMLVEYWPIIVGVVLVGYAVVKLAIRNAVLEIINEIQKTFSTKQDCHDCKEVLHRRIDNLQADLNAHKERKVTDTQKLKSIIKNLKED